MADWLPRAKILEPLGLRGFRILWTGMTVSLVGDGITLVAIAWQVFELSNLPTALGLTMMAMAVPQILLLLFGGFVSDRFERRRVMLLADLVRGGALLALGVLSLAGAIELWHMAAIAAVYGAGNAFFGPAFDAMVPDLVPDELLAQANALDHLVRPVALRLLGPALGGWIIAAVGVGWAFVVDAATFAISVACLLRLGSVHAAPSRAAGDAGAASVWTEIREGFDFVRSAVWLWGTFAAAALAYLVFLGPAEVLLPFLVKNELGGSASDLGNVYAMGGLGAIAASVTMAHRGMPARNMTFVYAAWTLSTLAVVGYGLAGGLWQVMLASFAFHALETAGLIVWLTTKQTHVPTRLLGRVSSLDWLISIGLMPVSYALAGPVAEWLGTRATLVGAGVLGAAITLSFLFLPGMRAVEKSRAGEAGEVPTHEPHRRGADAATRARAARRGAALRHRHRLAAVAVERRADGAREPAAVAAGAGRLFVPSGLAVMEMSSRHEGQGGLYLWVKDAFGEGHGFVAGWSYLVANLVFFPTLLLFIAGTALRAAASLQPGLEEAPRSTRRSRWPGCGSWSASTSSASTVPAASPTAARC